MPNFAKLTGSGAVPNTAVRRISRVSRGGTASVARTAPPSQSPRRSSWRCGRPAVRRRHRWRSGQRPAARRRHQWRSGRSGRRSGGRRARRRAESAGGVGGRCRRAESARRGMVNNRTGAEGAVGASGMSASGSESGFGLLRSRVRFPLKSLFGLRGNLDGRGVVRLGCGPTWRCPRLHSTASDEARRWLVGKPRISALKWSS